MNQSLSTAPTASAPVRPGVRHPHPVAVQQADRGTAFGLLLKTPPCLARLAVLLGCGLAGLALTEPVLAGASEDIEGYKTNGAGPDSCGRER